MFAPDYFAEDYFAAEYWPPGLGVKEEVAGDYPDDRKLPKTLTLVDRTIDGLNYIELLLDYGDYVIRQLYPVAENKPVAEIKALPEPLRGLTRADLLLTTSPPARITNDKVMAYVDLARLDDVAARQEFNRLVDAVLRDEIDDMLDMQEYLLTLVVIDDE